LNPVKQPAGWGPRRKPTGRKWEKRLSAPNNWVEDFGIGKRERDRTIVGVSYSILKPEGVDLGTKKRLEVRRTVRCSHEYTEVENRC